MGLSCMKPQLRLLILDYPKLLLNQDDVKKAFSDMLIVKQQNFERASKKYVSMGPLDMISTHFLAYDQTHIHTPRLVGGVRVCYESRAKHHQLRLPVEDYISYAPLDYQKKFERFRSTRPNLVDTNAGFIDPDYTYSKTGMKILEMLYFSLVLFIIRKGFDHWVGATNERFKASRWAMPTGYTEDGMVFTHPKVSDPHKLLLFERLNYEWVLECSATYNEWIEKREEHVPPQYPESEILLTADEAYAVCRSQLGGGQFNSAA